MTQKQCTAARHNATRVRVHYSVCPVELELQCWECWRGARTRMSHNYATQHANAIDTAPRRMPSSIIWQLCATGNGGRSVADGRECTFLHEVVIWPRLIYKLKCLGYDIPQLVKCHSLVKRAPVNSKRFPVKSKTTLYALYMRPLVYYGLCMRACVAPLHLAESMHIQKPPMGENDQIA